eukprot:TRINITY_DN74881_c0_g1_i1.p1 TRINITY_DN74881_c0_g1~~TRINITY_DN74881_c0_g1_i1.p1  ORF type:complete len:350 (-),score=50.45 TRINITY_DN74881_c0_g1_i1:110-1159(-)
MVTPSESHACANNVATPGGAISATSATVPGMVDVGSSVVLGDGALNLGAAITEAHAAELLDQGFTVIGTGFLGEQRSQRLRSEILQCASTGSLKQHRFQFGEAQFEKPGIYEGDLHDDALREKLPDFSEVFFDDSLADRLGALLPECGLGRGPQSKTIKLQHNTGEGGCFPTHYDNAGRPSKRVITVVVYLNPNWAPGHGGELVLHPFLKPSVVIPPKMDRAVVFLSDRVLHSVRPARAERFCFSIWLDGDGVNSDTQCNLTASRLATGDDNVEFFRRSPLQRTVSRAVYAEEYEASLIAGSMQRAAGCEVMLEGHRSQVSRLMRNAQLAAFVNHLRGFRVEGSVDFDS